MTKVYGTGVYDFRRHRVAEYPLESAPQPQQQPVNVPMTLVEIQRDRLTKIAESNWSNTNKKPFSAELVKEIYETELLVKGGRKTVPLQRGRSLSIAEKTNCLLFMINAFQVATVDKFQGQQNDFILLSLVRTRFVGHLRDVRRLLVAMSRARLGLYVFCRRSLFEQCYELQPTFQLLLQRPDLLAINVNEATPLTDRHVSETGPVQRVSDIEEMANIVNFKMHQVYRARMMSHQFSVYGQQILPSSMETGTSPSANGAKDDINLESKSNETAEQDTDMPLEGASNGGDIIMEFVDVVPENNSNEQRLEEER